MFIFFFSTQVFLMIRWKAQKKEIKDDDHQSHDLTDLKRSLSELHYWVKRKTFPKLCPFARILRMECTSTSFTTKLFLWVDMNEMSSESYVALPTVRAENFWARPAHSRQRKTSSGQTRILTQCGNKLSKLRTVQNFTWTSPKHTNYLWETLKVLLKNPQ